MIEEVKSEAVEAATEAVETEVKVEAAQGMFVPAPTTPHEKAIADYLERTASAELREKIAEACKAGFGIFKCYGYIKEAARKQANDGCAMIADDVVFGWAVHYYEDEWMVERERAEKDKADAEKRRKEAIEHQAKWKAEREAAEAKRREDEARAEEEKLAAMTADERLAYEREKARREAEEAEREAERKRKEEEAKRKAEEREKKRKEAEEKKRKAEEAAKAQMTFF